MAKDRVPPVGEVLAAVVGALPGGVDRAGQRAMADAVAAALDTGTHLLVQAGTGTGKSVAYLVPALRAGRPVVVSTATLALQAQLVDVDLPRVLDAVEPVLGRRPVAALLKGRSNYACLLRLAEGVAEEPEDALLPAAEPSALAAEVRRLREWADETETGDREEVDPAPSPRAWAQVSVSARDCVGASRCAYGDDCFAERAREAAREADVVVTNHALLAVDVLSDAKVLPDHGMVVVDEAHELADKVSDAASDLLSPAWLQIVARRAAPLAGGTEAAALDEAVAGLVAALAAAPPGRLAPLPGELRGALSALRAAAADAARSVPPDPEDPAVTRTRRLVEALADTAERMLAESPDDVVWVEEDERARRVVAVAPLDVAGRLAESLFGTRTVVATSATLTVGGDFGVLAGRLGLPAEARVEEPAAEPGPLAWRGLDVGSPFDYDAQAVLYVAGHLPEPTTSGITPEALDELVALVEAAGGRTLGLFSSLRSARLAAEAVRERTGLRVLVQGEQGLGRLVRLFREDAGTCLFGTLSLWQGVDAPGPTCQLVVVDRIPFPRPDEPLYAARAEAAGREGFLRVYAARAALLLAQGAGRLVRSADDRGVLAVLDSRLVRRRYAEFLRRSLPPMRAVTDREKVLAALRRIDAAARDGSPG